MPSLLRCTTRSGINHKHKDVDFPETLERALSATKSTKRKRGELQDDYMLFESNEEALVDLEDVRIVEHSAKRPKRLVCQDVQIYGSNFPKSQYHGWVPPLPISSEPAMVKDFLVS